MGNGAARGGEYHDLQWSLQAPHEVRLAATEILKVAGMSGYHTSVLVDDREYFFDCLGIMVAPPLWSHITGQVSQPAEARTQIIDMGTSACGGKALVQALHPYFQKGSYDIFYKNCNTFTDAALYFLTKSRLPGHHNRIERLVTATNPISTNLINRMFRNVPQNDEPSLDFYVPNPVSDGFSVDELIAGFEEDSDSENSESSDEDMDGLPCNMIKRSCPCRQNRVRSLPLQDGPW